MARMVKRRRLETLSHGVESTGIELRYEADRRANMKERTWSIQGSMDVVVVSLHCQAFQILLYVD